MRNGRREKEKEKEKENKEKDMTLKNLLICPRNIRRRKEGEVKRIKGEGERNGRKGRRDAVGNRDTLSFIQAQLPPIQPPTTIK